MHVPDLRQVFKNYDRFDVGAVGEFDVAVLIDQYAGAADFAQVVSPLARRLLLRGAAQGRSGRAAGPALCLALVHSGKGVQLCRDLCRGLSKRYLHVHDVPEDWQAAGGQDRSRWTI